MKYLVLGYLTVGAITSIVTASVLAREDDKDSSSRIAYYATINGLMWPLVWPYVIVVAFKKVRNELNQ